jgi:hypothetical protein
MKRLLSLFCTVFFIAGCTPGAYFRSPNDVSKMEATIFFRNGVQKKGVITIELETNIKSDPYYIPDNFILLTSASGQEKISFDSVNYYKLGKDDYYPKVVDYNFDETRTGFRRLLFLKKLSADNTKIGLYELFRKGVYEQDGYHDEYLYYISLPGYTRLQTLSTNSSKLVPNFDTKMSGFVADCPILADKIRAKQKGYFVPYFAIDLADKVEVYKRIIDEYDHCK